MDCSSLPGHHLYHMVSAGIKPKLEKRIGYTFPGKRKSYTQPHMNLKPLNTTLSRTMGEVDYIFFIHEDVKTTLFLHFGDYKILFWALETWMNEWLGRSRKAVTLSWFYMLDTEQKTSIMEIDDCMSSTEFSAWGKWQIYRIIIQYQKIIWDYKWMVLSNIELAYRTPYN